jgi:flavin reductase (DIM6/NTAB) family NADH-FMN oxidoreductase RutF
MSVSEAACRAAFRLVALNVAIIASSDGEQSHGCTATVWVEDPRSPYLATALRRAGGTNAAIARSGRLAASVLGANQTDIARLFARSGERFARVPHRFGPLGQPLIVGALVTMECVVVNSVDFGTYDMVIARIEELEVTSGAAPLTFWDGSFRTVRALSSRDD